MNLKFLTMTVGLLAQKSQRQSLIPPFQHLTTIASQVLGFVPTKPHPQCSANLDSCQHSPIHERIELQVDIPVTLEREEVTRSPPASPDHVSTLPYLFDLLELSISDFLSSLGLLFHDSPSQLQASIRCWCIV